MILVALISMQTISAMEKQNPDLKDFYAMETCQQIIKKEIFKDPAQLCFMCFKFAQDYQKYEHGPIQDFKNIIEQHEIQLAQVKDESGRTVLHHTCFEEGKYQAAAPILLELVNDDKLFQLLIAQDNSNSTVLHVAASSGLVSVFTALIKAANRYAQDCPERKKKIFDWLGMTNSFGVTALYLAKQGNRFFKGEAYEASIKILEEAEQKYSPEGHK